MLPASDSPLGPRPLTTASRRAWWICSDCASEPPRILVSYRGWNRLAMWVSIAERKLFPLPRGPCQRARAGRSSTCRANMSSGAEWPRQTACPGTFTPVKARTHRSTSRRSVGRRFRTWSMTSIARRADLRITEEPQNLAGHLIVDGQDGIGGRRPGKSRLLDPVEDVLDRLGTTLQGIDDPALGHKLNPAL